MTRELAPYFADHRVGIVQSPQFFDVQQDHFNWLQRSAGATQEMFYRWIQPARDAVDAAICVGTNAVYRRSALRDSGGFAQIGHSEDVHTGVNMAKVGFRTRYVPVNLAKGVCPDNFDGFANQQYRWCTGSMSLLADPGFHRSALSVKQKLRFWTGFGRRVHQNGSHGLDHGYGNAMMLLGGGVVGGKVHGRWPGLGERQLVDGDLAVTTDYRSVIGEILHKRCGLANTRAVFPNVTTTTSGVVRSR